MHVQLRICNNTLYFAGTHRSLDFETKYYLPGQADDAVRQWYLQIFPVRGVYGIDRGRVLVMLKCGKKLKKQATVRVDQGGTLEIDTESEAPLDQVGDEFAAVRSRLPHLNDWNWKFHRTTEPVFTDGIAPGIAVQCNEGAQATVCSTTVNDMGYQVRAEYVRIMSAKWVVVHRGNRVIEIHLWPGAGEEINEIVETVHDLS